jgi:hypothetical protein
VYANRNSTDVHDATLKIQSNGPNTMDHTDFPDMKNIGSFALYKNFTLFEIVLNELVSKEEPLYFKPLPQPCKKHCTTQIQEKRHTTFKGKCNGVINACMKHCTTQIQEKRHTTFKGKCNVVINTCN